MEKIIDFIVDPLIWPVYFGVVMYFLGYIGGRFFFANVFAKQLESKPDAIERGTMRAWRLVTILHLIFETIFVVWLCFRSLPRVAEWPHIFLYLFSYVPIMIIDVFILIALASHGPKSKRDDESK